MTAIQDPKPMENKLLPTPGDMLLTGIRDLSSRFHHALFRSINGPVPLSPEALLTHFNNACAYCHLGFTSFHRPRLDRVIPAVDLGNPDEPHNNVLSCVRCKVRRNGNRPDSYLRRVIGPGRELDGDEVERRIRKIYDWTSQYVPLRPAALLRESVDEYEAVLRGLAQLRDQMRRLLAKVEGAAPVPAAVQAREEAPALDAGTRQDIHTMRATQFAALINLNLSAEAMAYVVGRSLGDKVEDNLILLAVAFRNRNGESVSLDEARVRLDQLAGSSKSTALENAEKSGLKS